MGLSVPAVALGVPFPLNTQDHSEGDAAPLEQSTWALGNRRGPRVALLLWDQPSQGSLDNF